MESKLILNGIILTAVLIAIVTLAMPKLVRSLSWQAMITPLASIIGSGFLVLGPILIISYGDFAPLVMVMLCVGAFLFGSAIRYNIAAIAAENTSRHPLAIKLDSAASWALAFAYFISVAYYLNLFGAFAVSLTEYNDDFHAKLLTSAVFLIILVVGWLYGFKALERLEQISVSIKLAIIAGLLVGLVYYFFQQSASGALVTNPLKSTGWAGITLAFGLIVTVQGFETSRYLGDEYSAETRIKTMRHAQLLSTAIYVTYIGLLSYVFSSSGLSLKETEIIDMMSVVAPVLPLLLVAAALSAQFSAAVADTGGSGGLISELTGHKLKANQSYVLLVACGLTITWSLNVFEIISYASRAFALYYALQSTVAAVSAFQQYKDRRRSALFFALAGLGFMIAVFGTPVEGG